ncbi:MAG TPA: PKD domain-containing protein [Flavipsychrobacter sp.]|nr:PKD domain-containing protein [Flavipsychrobacter sp.]
MNRIKTLLLLMALLLLRTPLLIAQVTTPDWAKQIYGTDAINGTSQYDDIATDKQGNIYALYWEGGYVTAGGQTTTDSTSSTVLTSWDCNGNLRWMKSFGASGSFLQSGNVGLSLEVDTLGGVYVAGYATSPQAARTMYLSTDTVLNMPAGMRIEYLCKYNSLGQFQWMRTPVYDTALQTPRYNSFSVSPSGEVIWFALLDTGTYDGSAFNISTRKYYAVSYNAAGSFQSVVSLALTPPVSANNDGLVSFKFDPVQNRFYAWTGYNANYGSLSMGNTPIIPPTGTGFGSAVLGAFNRQGQNMWVRQASPDKTSSIWGVTFDDNGTIYLKGISEPGAVFCGDTASNTGGSTWTAHLIALDSNAVVRWSNYASVDIAVSNAPGITYANNTLIATGTYNGTLGWNNQTITNQSAQSKGYAVKVNATTGVAQQLVALSGTTIDGFTCTALDKNGNVYLGGSFEGNMTFGSNTLSSIPSWELNHFLLKYKNVNCGCDLVQPAFSMVHTTGKTYQYSYTGGTPYTALSWDFGDGTPAASGSNPAHTYNALGTYTVCVTATNSCGSNTTCRYLTIDATGVDELSAAFNLIQLHPTPATAQLTIENAGNGTRVDVFDVVGKLTVSETLNGTTDQIDISRLVSGMYLLRFTGKDGEQGMRKFVKE